MYYSVISTTTYVRQLLEGQNSGLVHSIYRNTVNLRFGTNLLALQTAGSPISPLSLITELQTADMASLNIFPGQIVHLHIDEHSLCIECGYAQAVFSYKNASIYDSRLSRPTQALSCNGLCTDIKKALSVLKTGGFQLLFTTSGEEDTLVLSAARKCLKECSALFQDGIYESAANRLTKMIGLGMGLTPSGDDFLCGILAGLLLQCQEDHPFALELRRLIRFHLGNTNDLSASFLTCALNQHYSMAVKSLQYQPSSEELVTLFGEIGHSSGTDTLCGVLYALQLKF